MSPNPEDGRLSTIEPELSGAPAPLAWRERVAEVRRQFDTPPVANVVSAAILLAVFNVAQLADMTYAARLYSLAFLLLVPGTLLLALTSSRPHEASVRIAWALGMSILVLIVLGLVYSLVLPHLGAARPLRTGPLLLGVDVICLGALVAGWGRSDPLGYLTSLRVPRRREVLEVLGVAAVPLLACGGALQLNNGRSGALAVVVVLLVAALIARAFLCREDAPAWSVGVALYGATAAILLMTSMRSNHPFGYDIQSEFQVFVTTLQAGVWHIPAHGNAYAAMLSITVLPSVLTLVSHMSGIYVFKVVYPLVFAMFPVLVFVMANRWMPRRAALLGAIVVIVQGLYAADITGLARQEIGLLYFALFVVTGFDATLSRRTRQVGIVVTGVAMAITHYSTAYFTASLFVLGYAIYAVMRLVRREHRPGAIFTLPVLALVLVSVTIWNVTITRSAQNVGNLASSIGADGLQLLSGAPGTSLLQRFLSADVNPTVSASKFSAVAASYYAQHAPYLRPYPAALTAHYPIVDATAAVPPAHVPKVISNGVNSLTTLGNELILLVTAIGVVAFLWRQRRLDEPERAELAAFALGCLGLLGLLRLSGTVSALYNPPRGQVQGAPVLSVGLAFACAWLFQRPRSIGTAALAATGLGLGVLLFSDSGLSGVAFGGGGPATLVNYGEAYQRYYFTDADVASAAWVVEHDRKGQVVYADIYGGLQIYEIRHLSGLLTTVTPQVIEPGAMVYATSTNVIDGTARSLVQNDFAVFGFPNTFLERVKDVVFTTGSTQVYE